jgi:hypothetical protein
VNFVVLIQLSIVTCMYALQYGRKFKPLGAEKKAALEIVKRAKKFQQPVIDVSAANLEGACAALQMTRRLYTLQPDSSRRIRSYFVMNVLVHAAIEVEGYHVHLDNKLDHIPFSGAILTYEKAVGLMITDTGVTEADIAYAVAGRNRIIGLCKQFIPYVLITNGLDWVIVAFKQDGAIEFDLTSISFGEGGADRETVRVVTGKIHSALKLSSL